MSIINCSGKYHTFADYPGFREYYQARCDTTPPPAEKDRELLERFRPRFILPPGGSYPIDFYRDFLPYTVMKSWPDKNIVALDVNRGLLQKHRADRGAYLEFDTKRFRSDGKDVRWREGSPTPGEDRSPAVYGRIYRELVSFLEPDGSIEKHDLIFLKYNVLFATSGLPAELSAWSRLLLTLGGFDRDDWHVLDNFVAVHVVLDEAEAPIAIILAQHNHHRAFMIGKDIPLPLDERTAFDVALRSNEIYPASDSPDAVNHRVIRWSLYLDYLLSGENGPALKGADVTWGRNAGGGEFDYDLKTLSPCDPLYTSEMLLGQPRPFMGIYLGRDGPPGSDYYNTPKLLPMGNMLKFAYLKDGDPEDIALVRKAIDRKNDRIDVEMIMEHGGRRFLEDWREVNKLRIAN
ncbi:MAG: hypothetical protein RRA15_09730 [bacterium]|nr:hypothetical protein [bacterium]MDT8366759.1 hypothetical protein [bacterium]